MRDPEGLERFGIPVSEVNAHLQKDSAQYLSERGWGRPLQTQMEVHTDVSVRPLRDVSDEELRALAGLDAA
jgi:hypothetical protein